MVRMARFGWFAALFCLAPACGFAQGLASLDGEWRPTAGVLHGQPVPASALSTMKLTLTNGTFRGESSGIISSGSVILEPGSTSRARFAISSGSDNGRTLPAIFHLDGKKLTIVFSETGEFPAAFESTADNRNLVMIYELATAADAPPTVSSGERQSASVID